MSENKSGFMQFKDLEVNESFLRAPWEPGNDVWNKLSVTEAVSGLAPRHPGKVAMLEIVQRVRVVERVEPY